jgi:hypothetical protein
VKPNACPVCRRAVPDGQGVLHELLRQRVHQAACAELIAGLERDRSGLVIDRLRTRRELLSLLAVRRVLIDHRAATGGTE